MNLTNITALYALIALIALSGASKPDVKLPTEPPSKPETEQQMEALGRLEHVPRMKIIGGSEGGRTAYV
ncbi:hypothetical protein GQ602_000896 [Ophiocordyceps camponoti-floridani]|uniref:Uncharacterized protein n=1 Tax=Ophiocordyceps camponoti-floridani TaxID=2030778 RepID=A0A8H4QDB2_9HYPO|nr:hypothetical protein GQ602_000896 [Ophiocordyceps camponoti-floridani]